MNRRVFLGSALLLPMAAGCRSLGWWRPGENAVCHTDGNTKVKVVSRGVDRMAIAGGPVPIYIFDLSAEGCNCPLELIGLDFELRGLTNPHRRTWLLTEILGSTIAEGKAGDGRIAAAFEQPIVLQPGKLRSFQLSIDTQGLRPSQTVSTQLIGPLEWRVVGQAELRQTHLQPGIPETTITFGWEY